MEGRGVETYLLNLVNFIFKRKRVPLVLKSGQINPIFKNCKKTNLVNKRHNDNLEKTQSLLQKVFTTGSSSLDAALILSEYIRSKNVHTLLILATLDTQKTFDVVDHCILLRNLFLN